MLNKNEIKIIINDWLIKFNAFELDSVIAFFHENIVFENWDGSTVKGKKILWRAWRAWFNSRSFNFKTEALFVDEELQTATLVWQLTWVYNNKNEIRNGIDIITFLDDKIISKQTYIKTLIYIEGDKVELIQ